MKNGLQYCLSYFDFSVDRIIEIDLIENLNNAFPMSCSQAVLTIRVSNGQPTCSSPANLRRNFISALLTRGVDATKAHQVDGRESQCMVGLSQSVRSVRVLELSFKVHSRGARSRALSVTALDTSSLRQPLTSLLGLPVFLDLDDRVPSYSGPLQIPSQSQLSQHRKF